MHLPRKMLRMGRKRNSISRTVALFTLGAAVGAGIQMMRGKDASIPVENNGEGPAEVDL